MVILLKAKITYLMRHTMELDLPIFDYETARKEAFNQYQILARNSTGKMNVFPNEIKLLDDGEDDGQAA